MLRNLGWEVETVREHNWENEKHDYVLVARARELGRVFLTFDRLRKTSGIEVAREIHENGGRVIVVAGGPDQPIERAVGRLLFHHPEWFPFLRESEGWVYISDLKHNCQLRLRSSLHAEVRRTVPKPLEP